MIFVRIATLMILFVAAAAGGSSGAGQAPDPGPDLSRRHAAGRVQTMPGAHHPDGETGIRARYEQRVHALHPASQHAPGKPGIRAEPRTDPVLLRLVVAPAETLAVTTNGEGRAVVAIPGLLGSAFGFRKVMTALAAEGHRVLVIEPLGTGASSRPEGADYSLTAQSRRVEAVLDSLRVRDAVILCHSTGASIGLRLAARRSDLAAGIVSISGGPAERGGTPGLRLALRFAPLATTLGGKDWIRGQIRDGLVESSADTSWITEDVIEGYTSPFAGDLDGALRALRDIASANEPERLAPQLGSIRAPVHLLVGGAPTAGVVPAAEVAALAERLPRFAVDTVPGVGQYLHEERPEVVVEAVRAMIRRTGSDRAESAADPARRGSLREGEGPASTAGLTRRSPWRPSRGTPSARRGPRRCRPPCGPR